MTDAELRELDARIAREIMGWKEWRSPAAKTPEPDCWLTGDENSPTWAMWGWNPTTDMTDAWLVVEKMQANGRGCVLCDTCGKPPWHCGFEIEDEGVADTAPLAICLAAVAFVEASAPLTPTLRDAQDSAG